MKIIDAYWEKRNLNMEVCEIIFEKGERIDGDALSELEKKYDYIVAKITGDSIALVHALEDLGYKYLENQIVLYFLTEEFLKINHEWSSRFSDIECLSVTGAEDLDQISALIREGLYSSGRIATDPLLGSEVADLRISNWLKDLVYDQSSEIYKLQKKDMMLGYFVLNRLDIVHLNITQAAIFKSYQNKGFSFILLYNILKIAYNNRFKGIFASVSTGNINTINSISRFVNFSIKRSFVVMRKRT